MKLWKEIHWNFMGWKYCKQPTVLYYMVNTMFLQFDKIIIMIKITKISF